MAPEPKVTTSFRLHEHTLSQLREAAHILRRPQGAIAEEALEDYFLLHKLADKHQLTVTADMIVLTKIEANRAVVLECEKRNGLTPDELTAKYAAKYQTRVSLVLEKP